MQSWKTKQRKCVIRFVLLSSMCWDSAQQGPDHTFVVKMSIFSIFCYKFCSKFSSWSAFVTTFTKTTQTREQLLTFTNFSQHQSFAHYIINDTRKCLNLFSPNLKNSLQWTIFHSKSRYDIFLYILQLFTIVSYILWFSILPPTVAEESSAPRFYYWQ